MLKFILDTYLFSFIFWFIGLAIIGITVATKEDTLIQLCDIIGDDNFFDDESEKVDVLVILLPITPITNFLVALGVVVVAMSPLLRRVLSSKFSLH